MCWASVLETSAAVAQKDQVGGFEAGLPVSLTDLFSLPGFPSPTLAPASFPQLPLLTSAFSRSQFFSPSVFVW